MLYKYINLSAELVAVKTRHKHVIRFSRSLYIRTSFKIFLRFAGHQIISLKHTKLDVVSRNKTSQLEVLKAFFKPPILVPLQILHISPLHSRLSFAPLDSVRLPLPFATRFFGPPSPVTVSTNTGRSVHAVYFRFVEAHLCNLSRLDVTFVGAVITYLFTTPDDGCATLCDHFPSVVTNNIPVV